MDMRGEEGIYGKGKNARKDIEDNYSMEAGISKIKKVYREVLKK